MRYARRFIFPASHFNGADTYEFLEALAAREGTAGITIGDVRRILSMCHGHDFVYEITVEREPVFNYNYDSNPFVVDDEQLERLVAEWKNVNLSIHKDFAPYKGRVTTERMCQVLTKKIGAILDPHYRYIVGVLIWEGQEISAEEERTFPARDLS